VSRMHSLRSNCGQPKVDDMRYSKRRFGRKVARHLYRAESETTSTNYRRPVLSNGLTFSDSLRLNGYNGESQWVEFFFLKYLCKK
jgi:hypothetical protein